LNSHGFVDGLGIETFKIEIVLVSHHQKRQGLVEGIKMSKIEIPSIQDIDGSRFRKELIEDHDIVNLSMSNDDDGRDASMKIQEGMQFHSTFPFARGCPRKQRQTKIDGGGVQGIDRLIQLYAKGIFGIKASGPGNQNMGKACIDSPVSNLVGMGQSIA
jgi:hypothetical protein